MDTLLFPSPYGEIYFKLGTVEIPKAPKSPSFRPLTGRYISNCKKYCCFVVFYKKFPSPYGEIYFKWTEYVMAIDGIPV